MDNATCAQLRLRVVDAVKHTPQLRRIFRGASPTEYPERDGFNVSRRRYAERNVPRVLEDFIDLHVGSDRQLTLRLASPVRSQAEATDLTLFERGHEDDIR
jgi:hypothetical protein